MRYSVLVIAIAIAIGGGRSADAGCMNVSDWGTAVLFSIRISAILDRIELNRIESPGIVIVA
jgi:hypothetical protein